MIISIGSSLKVIESINRHLNYKRDINFFDTTLSNFESILYFIKNFNISINQSDICNSNIEDNSTGNRIINHTKTRLSFTSDFPANVSYQSHLPIFLELINRRLIKFKNIIKNNYIIDFIHCLDDNSNYNFKCNNAFQESNIFIPTNQMIHDFVFHIKNINPNLQFVIHLLVPPEYVNLHKDIFDTLSNPHLKIHYMTKKNGTHVITASSLCIHWNWDEIYNNIKNEPFFGLPFDFNPTFYKKLYPDLASLSNEEAGIHYINYGIKEDRVYKIDSEIKFNPTIYKKLYSDLSKLSDEDAKIHYICNGIRENRKYKYEEVFDAKKYKDRYPDLKDMTNREATQHFYQYGINEGRIII